MVNIEKMAETAMYIVTYAGTAKSCYMNGLSEAKKGNFEKAHELLKEGDNIVCHCAGQAVQGGANQAHQSHIGVLEEEVTSLTPQISLLMCHAEDQIMGAETLKTVIIELIELYQKKEN